MIDVVEAGCTIKDVDIVCLNDGIGFTVAFPSRFRVLDVVGVVAMSNSAINSFAFLRMTSPYHISCSSPMPFHLIKYSSKGFLWPYR